jgi:hypothetical protein
MEWFLNFAFTNIYGTAILLLPIYGLFWLLKKFIPSFPNPLSMVLILGVIGLFTLPSVPRYMFENKYNKQISERPEYKLVNTAAYGAIWEILTLFKAPTGFFHVVAPVVDVGVNYDKNNEVHEFQSLIFKYKEDPRIELITAFCDDKNKLVSSPDKSGVFRYTSSSAIPMVHNEYKYFCELDYTQEAQYMRNIILNK